jgi:outer membrane protein assembly factor BamB
MNFGIKNKLCCKMKKLAPFLLLFLVFSACDKEKKYDKAKAVSAFVTDDKIKIDPDLQNTAIILPKQQQNNFWSGSASQSNQLIENFAKSFSFKKTRQISLKKSLQFWSFYRGSLDDNFVFAPVIVEDKAFILDTTGKLVAYDLKLEEKIWQSQIFHKKILKNYRTPKIGYSNNKIFAVAGVNKIVCVNAPDGKVLWSRDISSIPVSSPVSDGNFVYVTTNDNKIYALNNNDGKLQWLQSGILRNTTIFGAADPLIYKDLVVASYSSGEIYAFNKKTGELLWSQNLNLNKATDSDFYLNDIDATPLAKDDIIYSIGNGGEMLAIDVRNGNYIWKKEIAGIVDFWMAGDFLFLIDNDNKLLALSKKSGGIKWLAQLPNLMKKNKPQTKIIYSGVIMAGDKLLISNINGELLIASPFDGKIEKTLVIGKRISHVPVIINNKIYLHSLTKYAIHLVEIE